MPSSSARSAKTNTSPRVWPTMPCTSGWVLSPATSSTAPAFSASCGNALDLLHEGTGGIMVGDAARIQLVVHGARHAVTADDHLVPGGHMRRWLSATRAPFFCISSTACGLWISGPRVATLQPFVQQAIGQVHRPLDTKAEPRRLWQLGSPLRSPHRPIFSHASSRACLLARSFLVSRRLSMANCSAGIGSP